VLVNLLSNAIKFTPDGGRITVAISAAKRGLRVEVTDTGVGISPHTQAKLFKDFVQGDVSIGRKYGGTGLGLAISKRFISAMGGTHSLSSSLALVSAVSALTRVAGEIGCHSQENQGSTFWFLIPLKTVKHPLQIVVSLACEDAAPGSARRKRVLLVDDNAVNQKVCLRMLGALGFDAIVASNGHECLNVLLRSDPLFFDAILMDFHMPVLGTFSHSPA
jgi:CheY-like chemotaxis protein